MGGSLSQYENPDISILSGLFCTTKDGETEYLVLRIVLVLLSLAVFYAQIERWASWKTASRTMFELENELARFKDLPDHRTLLLFCNYQVAICNSSEIEPNVYHKHHKRLNLGWQKRVATLIEEWKDKGAKN